MSFPLAELVLRGSRTCTRFQGTPIRGSRQPICCSFISAPYDVTEKSHLFREFARQPPKFDLRAKLGLFWRRRSLNPWFDYSTSRSYPPFPTDPDSIPRSQIPRPRNASVISDTYGALSRAKIKNPCRLRRTLLEGGVSVWLIPDTE